MNDMTTLLGLRGSLAIETVESEALQGNPLGDAWRRPLAVYTPPDFDPQGSRRYPVLYCLHGYTGDVAALVSARPWERNVVQWADRLIAERAMPPVILAVVDGFTRLGGSQYIDSIHNGGYATYVVRDVVAFLDERYPTVARAEGRGVFGKSSGGFGALHLTLTRPGTFGAFASHSGDAYFRYAALPSFATAQRTLERYESIEAFVEAFETKPKRPQDEYVTMEMLGYAAAYSPRAPDAFAFDLPFERDSGALREDVFARWLAYDPCEAVLHHAGALAPLRLRYIDCGRRDEYALDIGARILAERIRELGFDVHHEEFDDDHRNVGYRAEIALPLLAQALDAE